MSFAGTGARRLLARVLIAATVTVSSAAFSLPTQSWNGYHWNRTGPLAIQLGSNVSADWSSYVRTAGTQWTAANNIDFIQVAGTSSSPTCSPVYGTVQVCNGNYGANGWLGYATVYTSGTVILEATVKLNDYYFTSGSFNTPAWRTMTACQEIGHTLGLAHNDTIKSDLNNGTCMDYTNDPTGTKGGANGTLANLAPDAADFAALNTIYAHLDATQLPQTKPGYRSGDALGIGDGDGPDDIQALPEPTTWALFIAGFGGVGGALRRRPRAAIA